MKNRRKRKFAIAELVRVSLGVCILAVFCIGAVMTVAAGRDEPLSAVGIFACGQPIGVAVTLKNGQQKWYPRGTPGIGKAIEAVPENRRAEVRANGSFCVSTQPKVY